MGHHLRSYLDTWEPSRPKQDPFPRGTMDAASTVYAISLLESLAQSRGNGVIGVTAQAILQSAAYHLSVGLRAYLTKGEGQ